MKGLTQAWFQLLSLAVIDEQTHQIEQAGEPHHHADDVQGLEPEVGLGGPGEGEGKGSGEAGREGRHGGGWPSARVEPGYGASTPAKVAAAQARIAASSSAGIFSNCRITKAMRGLRRSDS